MDPYNQTPNQAPNPAPQAPRPSYNMPPQHKEGSLGPIIATVIILAVIVLGGLYFWGQRKSAEAPANSTNASVNQTSPLNSTSIEQDLKNTDTNSLDTQINAS
jgi:uncharacterized protein HemX